MGTKCSLKLGQLIFWRCSRGWELNRLFIRGMKLRRVWQCHYLNYIFYIKFCIENSLIKTWCWKLRFFVLKLKVIILVHFHIDFNSYLFAILFIKIIFNSFLLKNDHIKFRHYSFMDMQNFSSNNVWNVPNF